VPKNIMGTKKHNGDRKMKNIMYLYENEETRGYLIPRREGIAT
jgi:hypothetical protein